MRKRFVAIALAGLAAFTGGADQPKPAAALKVGDPAPPLKADRWLQGEEVRRFEPGHVYVVEFWATWCGPCIWIMPHTAELQARYKGRGVTVIAFTSRDLLGGPNNTAEKVAAFVKKRGPKLPYTFAYADDSATADAWMKAAGKRGIPCAFVVDKAGRIAHIGSPMYLGAALPMVLAGAAPEAVRAEVDRIDKAWNSACLVQTFGDDEDCLRALRDLEARYPAVGQTPFFLRGKLSFLVRAGEADEAKKLAEGMLARADEQDDPVGLAIVATFLRQPKAGKELLAVAVKAAEARTRVAGDQDVRALIDLAEAYRAAGDPAKARESARKAALAAGDKDAGALVSLAELYRALGDKAAARECVRKAGQAPGDKPAGLLLKLSDASRALGDKAAAREYADRAARVTGDHDETGSLNLATTYDALGDGAKAREYVRKAGAMIGDKDVGLLWYLADTARAVGDRAAAREYARHAGALVGGDARLLIKLAKTYDALGDKSAAREYARKAVAAATGEYAVLRPYIERAARKLDGELRPVK
jgi:thiol-disulfide isomerase/thioredoxin/Tfp pilus assembly protein PilF